MSYTTVEQVRRRLQSGGVPLPATDDDLLDELITEAQSIIDALTGYTFEAVTETRRFDALADLVDLDRPGRKPYAAVERSLWLGDNVLAEAPTSITNGDGTTIASSEYVLEPRNGPAPYHAITLKSGSTVAWTYDDSPENAIAVAGKYGYSVEAPAAIQRAASRLVVWMYRQRESSSDSDRPIVTGDGAVVLPMAFPRDVLDILQAYKRLT